MQAEQQARKKPTNNESENGPDTTIDGRTRAYGDYIIKKMSRRRLRQELSSKSAVILRFSDVITRMEPYAFQVTSSVQESQDRLRLLARGSWLYVVGVPSVPDVT